MRWSLRPAVSPPPAPFPARGLVGWRRIVVRWCTLLLAAFQAVAPAADDAAALLERHVALQPQLMASGFGEPVLLTSSESAGLLQGDVHAEVPHPMAALQQAVGTPRALCELLLLHLNVHTCQPVREASGDALDLVLGPKRVGAVGITQHLHFAVQVQASGPAYLRVTLQAAGGSMSTQGDRLVFEAVPLAAGGSFVHLGYAYRVGLLARLSMKAYLATAGHDKIGFTVESRDASGRPQPITGERAAIERNVMRYYLALLASCSVSAGSPAQQRLARQRTWFALTERHAAQLHEYGLDDYLQHKRTLEAAGSPPR